jgi:hypothetical protein
MRLNIVSVLALIVASAAIVAAADLAPIATPGKLIVADDFNRAEFGERWRTSRGIELVDGVLAGSQKNPNHGTVARMKVEFRDAVIQLRFRLNGARYIAFVSDDKLTAPTTHSGHLCRVFITPTSLRVGDDKEGAMRNDILALRSSDDEKKKAEAEKLLVGRSATEPFTFAPERWYQLTVEIVGDVIQASIDGKPVVRLQSPGIAHPTKREFGPTIGGERAEIDDLQIFEATPIAK